MVKKTEAVWSEVDSKTCSRWIGSTESMLANSIAPDITIISTSSSWRSHASHSELAGLECAPAGCACISSSSSVATTDAAAQQTSPTSTNGTYHPPKRYSTPPAAGPAIVPIETAESTVPNRVPMF